MINGLGVLGWGVGGIEAEAAMLGQPLYMLTPQVVGFRLTGKLREGVTATDLVLTVTQMLRKKGVVEKFVEFFGPGLGADEPRRPRDHRQHGARVRRDLRLLPGRRRDARATCARTGRSRRRSTLVERYCKEQGLFRTDDDAGPGLHATRSSSTSARSSRASPARSARRTASPLAQMKAPFRAGADGAGEGPRLRPRRGRARAHGHGRDGRRHDARSGTARWSSPPSRAARTPRTRR